MSTEKTLRPTKKQKELLDFISTFIAENGYSPSYREIMAGCRYTSVATVALHINNLIKRGHLRKRDNSARSLELVTQEERLSIRSSQISESQEKWLIEKIDHYFLQTEQASIATQPDIDRLYVLIGALKVLGLEGAAQSFLPRLSSLKQKKGSK